MVNLAIFQVSFAIKGEASFWVKQR
jgi:hypothetical protein